MMTRILFNGSLAWSLLVLGAHDGQAADVTPMPFATAPVQPLPLTDEIIKKAVRDTLAEMPVMPIVSGGVLRADTGYSRLGAAFDEAKVPDCLHADALKHQPAHIGPVNVVGPLSLPWVVAAAVRGKCR